MVLALPAEVSTGVAPGRLVGPQLGTPSASVRQYVEICAPCPPTGAPASGASGQPSGLSSHPSRRPQGVMSSRLRDGLTGSLPRPVVV
jgi:hypothetical protein